MMYVSPDFTLIFDKVLPGLPIRENLNAIIYRLQIIYIVVSPQKTFSVISYEFFESFGYPQKFENLRIKHLMTHPIFTQCLHNQLFKKRTFQKLNEAKYVLYEAFQTPKSLTQATCFIF